MRTDGRAYLRREREWSVPLYQSIVVCISLLSPFLVPLSNHSNDSHHNLLPFLAQLIRLLESTESSISGESDKGLYYTS